MCSRGSELEMKRFPSESCLQSNTILYDISEIPTAERVKGNFLTPILTFLSFNQYCVNGRNIIYCYLMYTLYQTQRLDNQEVNINFK